MPGGNLSIQGNEAFNQALYVTITPPATVTTAVITSQNVALSGVLVGDIVSANIVSPTSNLLSIANMYVSAPNVLTIGWSTEGATVSSAAAQTILLEIARPANASLGLTALPSVLV